MPLGEGGSGSAVALAGETGHAGRRGRIPLLRVAGIDVRLDLSWFLIFALVASGRDRLLVMRGERLLGMFSKSGLARFLEIREVLDEGEGSASP